jgi:hypothetical protein
MTKVALLFVVALTVLGVSPKATVSGLTAHPGQNGPLTEAELAMARTAWGYFDLNYQEKTGLVNAVDGYPSTTMWDTASYLGGLVAARELGLIDKFAFDRRMLAISKTLNTLSLYRDELPNKAYNTITAAKVNYANQPGEIGYSAIDLGRMLIWLRIIKERYPEHASAIDHAVLRWNFCKVLDRCGTMYGAVAKDQATQQVQEGRLGYEEYAAKGFQLWGFDTEAASNVEPFEQTVIFGVPIVYDKRDPRKFGAHNYVVSESYVLDGIEFNWDLANDRASDDMMSSDALQKAHADAVYLVQQKRYEKTGILTARTEHQLDQAPYFVYDTVYTDGYAWNTISDDGTFRPEFAAMALKGALGLWALWKTPYTEKLFDASSGMFDAKKGFFEGVYENGKGVINTFTANNNGIILETLLYKVQGKLLKFGGRGPSVWDAAMADTFGGRRICLRAAERRQECGP